MSKVLKKWSKDITLDSVAELQAVRRSAIAAYEASKVKKVRVKKEPDKPWGVLDEQGREMMGVECALRFRLRKEAKQFLSINLINGKVFKTTIKTGEQEQNERRESEQGIQQG